MKTGKAAAGYYGNFECGNSEWKQEYQQQRGTLPFIISKLTS
jgi:hypothetical protein